jgi:predicted phage baseplate assembly protein
LPWVSLAGDGRRWTPRADLLASDRFAPEFVLEVESGARAYARFGDDVLGKRPSANAAFTATYRVGNGSAGNVGREAIAQMVTALRGLEFVRNPMVATSGVDPEALPRVRFDAPQAFRTQERAVTEADYARAAERHADVQRAAARFRWTGSWYTVFVIVDRKVGRPVDADFRREMRRHLERFRLAGYDLEVRAPRFAPLEIAIHVCANDGYFRADVKEALLRVFSAGEGTDGTRGFFHPDNFSFGDPVYLSRIYAAASSVDGVRSVEVTKFQRWGKAAAGELALGFIQPSPIEILELANDRSLPENGRLDIDVEGGL